MKFGKVLHANHGAIRQCKPSVTTPVFRLFSWRSPSAIGRFVVSIIVDSIELVAVRTWTHVGVEFVEVFPAPANFNFSSTVAFIGWVGWIKAALFHRFPRMIGGAIT